MAEMEIRVGRTGHRETRLGLRGVAEASLVLRPVPLGWWSRLVLRTLRLYTEVEVEYVIGHTEEGR